MKAIFFTSNVPSNVGNDFFYFGLRHVIAEVAPNITLVDAPFPPFNPFGLNARQQNRYFHLERHLESFDAVVVAGPVLDRNFDLQFGSVLRKAKRDKKKIFILSCGARVYDEEEYRICSQVLADVQPDIFVSRDHQTFESYGRLAKNSYNGICFAFYVAEAYVNYSLTMDCRYCVAAFDFAKEHPLKKFVKWEDGIPSLASPYPKTGTKSIRNKLSMVLQRNFEDSFHELKIVRPCHRPIRRTSTMLHKPNAFTDFESLSFLHLYANTEFTITDRLHAAVATMAFGRPAHLPLETKRAQLLTSAGCERVLAEFFQPEKKKLDSLRAMQKVWLKERLDVIGT